MYKDLHVEVGDSSRVRARLDAGWLVFKERYLMRMVAYLIDRPSVCFSAVGSLLVLTVGLLLSGHLSFTFFPSIPGQDIYADVRFVSGVTADEMNEVLSRVENAAYEASSRLSSEELIELSYQSVHSPSLSRSARDGWGDQYLLGHVAVRLISPGDREVSNARFAQEWQKSMPQETG